MFQKLLENLRLSLIALQFLSRLPVKFSNPPTEKELVSSERYFPLVGLLLGLILVVIDLFFRKLSFPLVGINVILIAAMMIFTGGLHLDGFADTLDAFYSGKDKDKMLEIMKDSRLGVIGGAGLIIMFALQMTFLQVIPLLVRTKVLLIMPMISRTMMVNQAFLGIYPREEGLGKIFIEDAKALDWFIAMFSTLFLCVFLFKILGVMLFLLCFAISLTIMRASVRRIEGVTGDVLGLTNEVITLVVLIVVKFLYLNS